MGDKPSASKIVGRGIWLAICSVPFGAFMGWFFAWSQSPALPLLPTIINFVSILGAICFVVGLLQGLGDHTKAMAVYTKALDAQRRREASDREHKQTSAVNGAKFCSDRALRSYRSAAQHLMAADAAVSAALQHRSGGASTPFWAAIEEGYEHLGQHNQDLDAIRGWADQYPSLLAEVAKVAPNRLSEVPPFPLEASKIADIGPGSLIAGRLQALTYDAQKDFQYASIFEQRRTTAAVIAGFRSLSAAVAGMSAAIHDSTRSMVASVDNISVETGRVNDSLNVSGFSAGTGSVAAEVRQLNENLAQLGRR